MKKTHNLVAVVGTYKDNAGQDKKRYQTIGAAFTRDDGTMALKIEVVPAGNEWNGWVNLFLPRDNTAGAKPEAAPSAAAPQPASAESDSIPFGD